MAIGALRLDSDRQHHWRGPMVTRVRSLLVLAMLAACSLAVLRMSMLLTSVNKHDLVLPPSVGAGGSGSTAAAMPVPARGVQTDSPFAVKVDPYARALAAGLRDTTVYGFDIAALWRKESIPELWLLRQRYNAFAERLRAIPSGRDKVYVYPFEAFHCTVAALVKFTAPALTMASPEVRRKVRRRYPLLLLISAYATDRSSWDFLFHAHTNSECFCLSFPSPSPWCRSIRMHGTQR